MKRLVSLALALAGSGVAGSAAWANVPVIDSPILTQRSEESSKKVEIKKIQDGTSSSTQGVNCSVTRGKKAEGVKSPTQAATSGGGKAALEQRDPSLGSSPVFKAPDQGTTTGSVGGNAAERAYLSGTGDIVANNQAVESSVPTNKQTLETMSKSVGQDTTVMEAFDRNSAIRTQGGLTFNQALQAMTVLSQAWNQGNLNTAGMTSRAAGGISTPSVGAPAKTCPTGTTGQGTAQSPCVAAACSTTTYGTTPAAGCVAQRYSDTYGNDIYIISQVQTAARAEPSTVSLDELQAAISQYQHQ